MFRYDKKFWDNAVLMLFVECRITCHSKCQYYIPDFCGLSMDMANQKLAEIKAAEKRRTMDRLLKQDDKVANEISQLAIKSKDAEIQYELPPIVIDQLPLQANDPRYQDPLKSMTPVRKEPEVVQQRIKLQDFNFLFVLGKGNFGKVMLAENKYDTRLYAIKVLKKRFIIDNEEIER
jgi:hypothetical protein